MHQDHETTCAEWLDETAHASRMLGWLTDLGIGIGAIAELEAPALNDLVRTMSRALTKQFHPDVTWTEVPLGLRPAFEAIDRLKNDPIDANLLRLLRSGHPDRHFLRDYQEEHARAAQLQQEAAATAARVLAVLNDVVRAPRSTGAIDWTLQTENPNARGQIREVRLRTVGGAIPASGIDPERRVLGTVVLEPGTTLRRVLREARAHAAQSRGVLLTARLCSELTPDFTPVPLLNRFCAALPTNADLAERDARGERVYLVSGEPRAAGYESWWIEGRVVRAEHAGDE